MSAALSHALAYVSPPLRWSLFLTAAGSVTPIKHDGFEHGYKDATADPAEITRRLALFPDANLAVACGPDSGVLALDVDRKGDVDGFAALDLLQAEFGPLPQTVTSETPNGGVHLLFRYPANCHPTNRVGMKRWDAQGSRITYLGLDVRGRGASVALPPSSKPAGAYRWRHPPIRTPLAELPGWLLALMMSEPPARPPPPPLRVSSLDKVARYVAAAIDGECSKLARMGPNTGRNPQLFQCAANLGEFVGAGVLSQDAAEHALELAARDCGLVRDDGLHAVRATIASGMRKGITNPREIAA